jgi:hypothetical protein
VGRWPQTFKLMNHLQQAKIRFELNVINTFHMRADCVKTVLLEKTAFWNIVPCNFIEVDRHFRDVYCIHHQGPEDGDSTRF